MEEIACPPFLLRKENNAISVLRQDDHACICHHQDAITQRIFACLCEKNIRESREFNCDGFVEHLIRGYPLSWSEILYPLGEQMNMHDARRIFGLPYGIQYDWRGDDRHEVTHTAIVLGWDVEEPVLAEKPGAGPLRICHMKHSRMEYPHKRIYCYPAKRQ